MKKIIIFTLISFLFSQSEYQILTIPKNIFQLSSNNGLSSKIDLDNYTNPSSLDINKNISGFSLIQYPADISMYHLSIKNYTLSILDYGVLKDQIHNTINNEFSAQEILLQYYYNYNIRNLRFGLSLGGFYSNIDTYNSFGLISSLGLNAHYKAIDSYIGLSIENLGYILKSYTTYNIKIPLQYRFSYIKNLSSSLISYDIVLSKNDNNIKHILCFQFNVNDKIRLKISNSNYLKEMIVENNDFNFSSGVGIGINTQLKSIIFDVGLMNLGIAGWGYGMSINFIRN